MYQLKNSIFCIAEEDDEIFVEWMHESELCCLRDAWSWGHLLMPYVFLEFTDESSSIYSTMEELM
jgi:hypothetical protein